MALWLPWGLTKASQEIRCRCKSDVKQWKASLFQMGACGTWISTTSLFGLACFFKTIARNQPSRLVQGESWWSFHLSPSALRLWCTTTDESSLTSSICHDATRKWPTMLDWELWRSNGEDLGWSLWRGDIREISVRTILCMIVILSGCRILLELSRGLWAHVRISHGWNPLDIWIQLRCRLMSWKPLTPHFAFTILAWRWLQL